MMNRSDVCIIIGLAIIFAVIVATMNLVAMILWGALVFSILRGDAYKTLANRQNKAMREAGKELRRQRLGKFRENARWN